MLGGLRFDCPIDVSFAPRGGDGKAGPRLLRFEGVQPVVTAISSSATSWWDELARGCIFSWQCL